MIYETFREAVKNIWSNKFRTVLTMLGIIIGVTAVIVIVGLGNGMTQSIKDSFSEMGTNILSVQITGRGSRTVTVQQLYDIVDSHPEVFTGMSPTTTLDSTVKVDTTTYGYTSVKGVSETYLDMMGRTLAQGRGLTYVDITDNKKVCVVGDYIARAAYGGNAIGQTIKIGSERFTIVGVLEANVSSTTDQEGTDDDMIFVPYTTARRISKTSASSYGVVLVSDELADEGKNLLVAGIESILHAEDGYFITSLSEMLETMTSMINMVVAILTAIAAISLLVGGIGIMNIMMVSVTERTREIGIRKALGAKERSILALFVTEAATTSALGGLLGIALGYLFSALANRVIPLLVSDMELTVAPSMTSVLVAFGISVGIGVLFGYLPAKRAARLNPIEAPLRSGFASALRSSPGRGAWNRGNTILRRIFHEKKNPFPFAGGEHRLLDAGGAGKCRCQQCGGADCRDAGRLDQRTGLRPEHRLDPGPAGKAAGGILGLPGERRHAGEHRHPVHRRGQRERICPLYPHCCPAGVAQRLYRWLFPARQRCDAGRGLHRRPQAAGL